MTWKSQLRPASFRGVPFKIQDSDFSSGRRVVDYEYPDRDIGSTEDLGRKKREYSITGFVIGNDYLKLKNELISACEDTKGPGELIHPFFGSLDVVCKDCKVRESMVTDGGMATFSLIFTEAGLVVDPSASIDSKASILAASKDAKLKSQSKFEKLFSVAKQPGHVIEKAQSKISSISDKLENSPLRSSAQNIAAFSGKLNILRTTSLALVQRPGELASFLGSSIESLPGAIGSKPEAYKPLMLIASNFGQDDSAIYSANDIGERERANNESLNNFIKEQAVLNAIECVIEIPFDNSNDLEESKEEILNNIDRMIDSMDFEFYESMTKMKATLIESFPSEENSLPMISKITLQATLPSLVVAYQLYGDARRESDIVKRNKIANPAFVPGGLELEVTSE